MNVGITIGELAEAKFRRLVESANDPKARISARRSSVMKKIWQGRRLRAAQETTDPVERDKKFLQVYCRDLEELKRREQDRMSDFLRGLGSGKFSYDRRIDELELWIREVEERLAKANA